MSSEEATLIQQAKGGDPAAFAEIYDRCQPAIYRYVYYQVNDAATAEDLTSEVFVRLVEKIDHFAYRGRPLLAWLYTIARNLITDHRRRARYGTPIELEKQPIPDATDVESTVEHTLAQHRLINAIGGLTDDQRQVILLKFIEGVDNATAAHVLGKSINAVKALQHRARASLRRILEQNGQAQ
jgi:RNA polymerase sigma-70 factor (ECF subfamily)